MQWQRESAGLVRKEQYRYRDIGVIVSDMNVYGDYLEQAFEELRDSGV